MYRDNTKVVKIGNRMIGGGNPILIQSMTNTHTEDVAATVAQIKELTKAGCEIIRCTVPTKEAALAIKSENGTINDEIIEATQVIGEKITLRRFQVVEKSDSENFGVYLHMGGRIAVLTVVDGADETVAKDVAMHIAASNPKYVNRDQVPAEEVEHEKAVLTEEAKNEGKPEKIIEKMVEGRLGKFFAEIVLDEQDFVKDPDQTVAKYVASKNGANKSFTRYEVGEGIEKKADNFVEEVMSQVK